MHAYINSTLRFCLGAEEGLVEQVDVVAKLLDSPRSDSTPEVELALV